MTVMVIIILDAWFMINHASMFYSFGYNQYNIDNKYQTIHAEEHAIHKLKFSKKKRKVNVMIFRICNLGKNILSGKPCINCKKLLKYNIKKKGYKLNRVYYTSDSSSVNFLKNSEL